MLKFTKSDYETIHRLVFREGYPGYKPNVQEAPNGDDVWDTEKRYAHVALKYDPEPTLSAYFWAAYYEAGRVHRELGAPLRLFPDERECCLRILDYPPGAGSVQHTDFDFFTIQLYRDAPEAFIRHDGGPLRGFRAMVDPCDNEISPGIHFGEMAEVAGFRSTTPHSVKPLLKSQRSIVFFALPHRDAPLVTAGAWLDERYARSRRGA